MTLLVIKFMIICVASSSPSLSRVIRPRAHSPGNIHDHQVEFNYEYGIKDLEDEKS
jgi:hypothetical protein